MSRFGLSFKDFLRLTPKAFFLALEDNKKVEISKIRPVAEAIRRSTQWLVNVQVPKKKQIKHVKKIMIFPWEKDLEPKKPQTREQMIGTMKIIAGVFNK